MDAEWFVLFFVENHRSGPLHRRRKKMIQAVDTSRAVSETACAVGFGSSLCVYFMPYVPFVALLGYLALC